MDFSILVSIIVVAGFSGGFINFSLQKKAASRDIAFSPDKLRHCLLYGVCAASLMPLFLQMISSNLISDQSKLPYSYLVFFGFCLIASISSMRFINGVSSKVLAELEIVKEVQQASTQKIQRVEDRAKEEQDKVRDIDDEMRHVREHLKEDDDVEGIHEALDSALDCNELTGEQSFVLATMRSKTYAYRTVYGMSLDTGFSKKVVAEIIGQLIGLNLVKQAKDTDDVEFYLTAEGWSVLKRDKRFFLSELPRDIQEGINQGVDQMEKGAIAVLSDITGDAWGDYSRSAKNQMGRVFRYLVNNGQFPQLEEVEVEENQRYKHYKKV